MARVFLSIGSNIEPEVHFKSCAKDLEKYFSKPRWSPVYRSPAIGMQGDDFLNAVVLVQTEKSIESLCALLKQIESDHGRKRSENKFVSRTLDIDVLLYDDAVINTAELTLPRTELTSAAHVLKPLADIEPNGLHPVLNKTYQALLADLKREKAAEVDSLNEIKINLTPSTLR